MYFPSAPRPPRAPRRPRLSLSPPSRRPSAASSASSEASAPQELPLSSFSKGLGAQPDNGDAASGSCWSGKPRRPGFSGTRMWCAHVWLSDLVSWEHIVCTSNGRIFIALAGMETRNHTHEEYLFIYLVLFFLSVTLLFI